MQRKISLLLIVIVSAVFTLTACTNQQAQAPAYDPNKNYAAFLVANSPQAENPLKTAKEKSTREGLEIGPVIYYEPGTQDFTSHIKKAIPSKAITTVWLIGSLLDSPNFQKALAAGEYKVLPRYAPVTGQPVQ